MTQQLRASVGAVGGTWDPFSNLSDRATLTKDQQLEVWATGALQRPPSLAGSAVRTDEGEATAALRPTAPGAEQPASTASGATSGETQAA
eukprot:2155562-Lingulodinium_polyedra.AAC.1